MVKMLREQIKVAMVDKKNTGDGLRYQTLKNILEKAQKTAKEQRTDVITDSMVVSAAKKEIKELRDLLEYCEAGSDRYTNTLKCIEYAEAILPKMASEDEINAFLNANKDSIDNIGTAMKMLKIGFGPSLDGKTASKLAKAFLS